MKISSRCIPSRCTTVLVSAAALVGGGTVAQAQDADFSFFYDSLSPYGNWVEVAEHGPCWLPAVEEGWAPYTNGNWAYTDVGWTWVSHEPFGSIVFHYGRWLLTGDGWAWVPGSDWAPAWVSWRAGNEYVGWAPLPPSVPWRANRGVGTWVDVHAEIGPGYYRFCAARDFGAQRLSTILLRPTKNITVMFQTENVTNISVYNEQVYCGGPQYRWLRERSARQIPVLRVCREENLESYFGLNIGGNFGTVQNFISNDMLVLPAPRRVDLSAGRTHRLPEAGGSVSRGWYEDSNANARLRSHLEGQWETHRTQDSRQTNDSRKADILVRPAAIEEKRAALLNQEGGSTSRRWVPGSGGNAPQTSGTNSAERHGSQSSTFFERSAGDSTRGGSGERPPTAQRVVPVSPSRSSEGGNGLSTPGIITERGVVPLERGVTMERNGNVDRGSNTERGGMFNRSAPTMPRAQTPDAFTETEPLRSGSVNRGGNVDRSGTLNRSAPTMPRAQTPDAFTETEPLRSGNVNRGGNVEHAGTVNRSAPTMPRAQTPDAFTETEPLRRGSVDRGGNVDRSGTVNRSAPTMPRAQTPDAFVENEPVLKSSRSNGTQNASGGTMRREGSDSSTSANGVPAMPKTRTLPNDAAGFVVPQAPSRPQTVPAPSTQGRTVYDPSRNEVPRSQEPTSNFRSVPVAPQQTTSGASYRSGNTPSGPQTMPSSRASSSIAPQPQQPPQLQPQQASPSQSTSQRGGAPQSGGGVPPSSGGGRPPASQSSGASLSSGAPPAAAAPAATTMKKKPGDPGYVPGQ